MHRISTQLRMTKTQENTPKTGTRKTMLRDVSRQDTGCVISSDRSTAIPSGIRPFFSTSERFAPHLLNSRRDQSDRSDFALNKTFDETGRLVTPICLLFLLNAE